MPSDQVLLQTSPVHGSAASVTAPEASVYPLHDASQSPSSAPSQYEPPDLQSSVQRCPLVQLSAPPYDEDEDDFNARAPSRSTNRSMLYPQRHGTPQGYAPSASSVSSTPTNTPLASRTASPQPFDYSGASSCDSDSESEPDSHFLHRVQRLSYRREGHHRRWWSLSFGSSGTDNRRYRRWRDAIWGMRTCRRVARRCVRHPLFPKTPVTILLTLLFLTLFGVSLTFLLIYILNPDKDPLPWRGYCTLPQYSGGPPPLSMSTTAWLQTPIQTNFTVPPFPPPEFDSLAPAGVFVGVFSTDTAVERRMLVRSTWAQHVRSREGAGDGDGGVGTSRTIVRFIMGQPRKEWERQVQLEMDTYNDIVVLPMQENMNQGKSHAYFTWAANSSWVPPVYQHGYAKKPEGFSYTNATNPPPALASHDPALAHQDRLTNASPQAWVRPDFVVKADDDAFVMLAELEGRLRVQLYNDPLPPRPPPSVHKQGAARQLLPLLREDRESAVLDVTSSPSAFAVAHADPAETNADPLVFWGYLIKNRFMGGEMYALSFALVDWVAHDPVVKTMTYGAEDKQTSKWIRMHPRADQVRWSSERCWIYDHPRASTVYSHGFLFPSEVQRVQAVVRRDLEQLAQQTAHEASAPDALAVPPGRDVLAPEKWARSTVSTFGTRYVPPHPGLPLAHSVEALVEGSQMSLVREEGALTADYAWTYREGRRKRYAGQRLGGTVVVHFIKKNMWFLETAAALLHGEDVTAEERGLEQAHAPDSPRVRSGEAGDESAEHGARGMRTLVRRWKDWAQH